jgi:hypothetical protein
MNKGYKMAFFHRKSEEEQLKEAEDKLKMEEAQEQEYLDEEEEKEAKRLELEEKRAKISELKARTKALKVAKFKRSGFGKVGAKVESVVKSVGSKVMQSSQKLNSNPRQPKRNLMESMFGSQKQSAGIGNRNPFATEMQQQPQKRVGGFMSGEFGMNQKPRKIGGFMAEDMALAKPKKKQRVILY